MPQSESDPLDPEHKAARAASFGAAATHYERYRPGPPRAAIDWILPVPRVRTVVDLGAGTGALSRLLVDRADEVFAVEPDDRMRAVLAEAVPEVRAVPGRAEAMPLPDASADAVIASSSWHWVDPVPALREVGRVLVSGGTLGAVWSGPDRDAPFVQDARTLLAGLGSEELDNDTGATLSGVIDDPNATTQRLDIPTGLAFDRPEHTVLTWDVSLDADELVGLLGTFSWVILMKDDARERLFSTARRLLRDTLGVEGDVTVEVGYRADVWKARRSD
jgi:SAM-dependent methyltransferase